MAHVFSSSFAVVRAVCRPWRVCALLGAGIAAALPAGAAPATPAGEPTQRVSHGLFDDVQVFRPSGEVKQFVLLLSGADGFGDDDRERAQALASAGAMVAGISVPPFYQRLQREGGQCSFANGAFENLAHHLQAQDKLPTYLTPMLAGRGLGGTLAYAMLAQAAPGTFSAALTLGFCPRLPYALPLCKANALDLRPLEAGTGSELLPKPPLAAPWVTLQRPSDDACPSGAVRALLERLPQGRAVTLPAAAPSANAGARRGAESYADALPAFAAAYAKLAERRSALSAPPASLADLPVVEVPAAVAGGNRFAILLSGDGGWAGISQGIAAALARSGIPVAGFDSLRYFWTARTPQRVADDLDRLIRYYAAHWRREEVLLIGYSQGADVLPFALNRLPAATRARVRQTTLLALGQKASFEFHVANWIGPSGDHPIEPEASRLEAARTLCIHGTAERDSPCPRLAPNHVRAIALPGGHHFGGDYDRLADLIVSQLPPR